MRELRSKSPRAHRLVVVIAGALVGVGCVGWSTGTAWASSHSPRYGAASSRREAAGAPGSRHPKPKLPAIGNATDLNVEPVVHPSKGKAPKKLEVKNLVVGTGSSVKDSSTVSVVYVGAFYKTGKDFTQATWTSHRATTFPLSGTVPGFAEGLVGMKVGGRREIVIPPKLGYGDKAYGPIPANTTLVFVVDLKAVSG